MVHAICQPNIFQQLFRVLPGLFKRRSQYLNRCLHHIFDGGLVWKKSKVLKHHAHGSPYRFKCFAVIGL